MIETVHLPIVVGLDGSNKVQCWWMLHLEPIWHEKSNRSYNDIG